MYDGEDEARTFKKKFSKPLDKATKMWYNKYEKRKENLIKPERITTMKKATMNTILSLIANIDTEEANAVRDELNAELNKGAEQKAANAELYEAAKPVVLDALRDSTATIGELYEAVKDELPEGFSKGKLQYAITRLWVDEIEKIEGKVNTYTLKA